MASKKAEHDSLDSDMMKSEEQATQRYLRSFIGRAIWSAVTSVPLIPILGVIGFVIGAFLAIWAGPLAAVGGTVGMITGAVFGGVAEYRRKKAGRSHFPEEANR